MYSAVGERAAAVTEAALEGAAVGQGQAVEQYEAASSIISELLLGKEPNFQESVYSRLGAAAATAAAPVKSAGEKIASVASKATEAIKEAVPHQDKDEL